MNDKYSINSEVVTDGKSSFIISGSEDDNVYIWNENGRVKQLTGHNDVVLSVAYDAGSKCLVSGCTDGSLGVWRGIELGTDSTPSRVSAEVNLFIDNQVADESNDNVDEIISMDS